MDRKIIVTDDNSKTLLIPELNETYHSTNGALNEARHVFISAGLEYLSKKESKTELNIFEMGFGTGLNVMVTLEYLAQHNLKVNYETLEKYPITESEINGMDYAELFENNISKDFYNAIHKCEWNKSAPIGDKLHLKKIEGDITTYTLEKNKFDILFFDAFGPRIQPDLWSTSVLKKMFEALKDDGILVTYCAQGQFKRNLKSVGFNIENIPGPPGKREMTRATKMIQA